MSKRKWSRKEIDEYRKTHGALFYYNKEDSNIFVSKGYGIGVTLNWANPVSWICILAIIAVIIILKVFF